MNVFSWLFTAIRGVPSGRLLGRVSAETGRTEALTVVQGRTLLGLGTAAVEDTSAFDAAGTAAGLVSAEAATRSAADNVLAAAITSHEADTTNVHGILDTLTLYRSGGTDVAVADGGTGASSAADARTNLGLGTAAVENATAFELSGSIGTHAAVTSGVHGISTYGASLVDDADAAAARTTLGLGTLATQSGTFSGASSGTNTGDQNLFSTIAVSGQSNVVADQASDTLTLAAGSNITITTDAATDTVTIAASGGSSVDEAKAVSGMWYAGQDPQTHGAGVAISANTLYLCPFRFGTQETWDAIFTYCNATGTATVARLGVYEADFTTGPPTFTLLQDAGTVAVNSTGAKSITGLARTIAAGKMVFLAILSDGTWTNLGATGTVLRKPLLHGQAGSINGGLVTNYMKSVTYGSLPSTVSAVSNGASNLPSSGLRIA